MINNTIAGVPVGLIEAPEHLLLPCEQCFESEADFAVGAQDHKLVCEPCLAWGDSRRWWHMEPRQVIGGCRVDMTADGPIYKFWSGQ